MLQTLHIENYALIRHSDISFDDGFVVITGETGAGKSILLGALGLLLGQRADTSVLADKEKKCIVEAQFNLHGLQLQPIFAQADIDYDETLILRREILPSGRTRAFANDTPVQVATLKQLGQHLIDIHSQHQTLTLADSAFRQRLLDTIANSDATKRYHDAYHNYTALKHQLEQLTATEANNRKEQDFLQFQFDELVAAQLVSGELESLEQESQLLAHAEAIQEGLSSAAATLDNESGQAILSQLRSLQGALSHIEAFHPDISALLQRIGSTRIELDDINSEILTLSNHIHYSSERQEEVDARLATLYHLLKKHNLNSIDELITLRHDLDFRLQDIASLDDRIHTLMEQVDQAYIQLQESADQLTASRIEAAKMLTEAVVPTLHQLGMPDARFEVNITAATNYTASGHDLIDFLFNANRGGELQDIARIASGGEMSRLMLAIKSMLTTHTLLPTIVFDEIDTGVSGDISIAVARIMASMSQRMQVVAITHLPQIAAQARQHLKVFKKTTDDESRTVSQIVPLSHEDRIHEIATMLSSNPPSEAALQTARELMLCS